MKGKERNGDKEEMKEWRVIGEDCIGRDFREGGRKGEKMWEERDTHTKINGIILILQDSPSYGWTAGNTSELSHDW